ncbi:related to indole-3-acetaldehyde dehydrogenase [Serendipita indica DSM 11827]|uniref:aldehyde dehydrogenase (NAD(+)) n=1 Tax=Serendipita indica (strain DSM 11827) TaxID=1109443 RepID=G4TI21_SERID|nr:related to indole-3-acetaldehyde dehydrogenase [Serendipita indica DSM 11827]
MTTFTYQFNTPTYKGSSNFPTGLFIGGKFVDGSEGKTIDVINPTSGKVITAISEGGYIPFYSPPTRTRKDVDVAVATAHKAFEESWGLKVPGSERGRLLMRLADLIEQNAEELAALEALDNGKAYKTALGFDVAESAAVFRYYGGWAVLMLAWKLGPSLSVGCTVVLKPSELTPLTALRICSLINEAGFPPGVVNIVTGYGNTVGAAIAEHPHLEKVAFTGSTLVGRSIMKAAASSNLKKVTLELGGKSPNIIFDDADIDQAVKWSAFGIFFNHGQCCCAGSRVYVQASIYDKFVDLFTKHVKTLKVGDPFEADTFQGPQVSQTQQERIMGYINSGKAEGATVHMGGDRHGEDGYFIQPTVFTDTTPDMTICREEIFGPVVVVSKFEDEKDIIKQANDSMYGLAAAVFSRDITRALTVANKLQAGTVWVNCYNQLNPQLPFGGYKASGFGRELGEYALQKYVALDTFIVT